MIANFVLVPRGGFEPPTPASSERCSNQLSYLGKNNNLTKISLNHKLDYGLMFFNKT